MAPDRVTPMASFPGALLDIVLVDLDTQEIVAWLSSAGISVRMDQALASIGTEVLERLGRRSTAMATERMKSKYEEAAR